MKFLVENFFFDYLIFSISVIVYDLLDHPKPSDHPRMGLLQGLGALVAPKSSKIN